MKKKLLVTLGIIAAAFMAFYYFYIYNIDVKKAKLIIAGHLKKQVLLQGKSDDFLISWARAIRWKFLDTFSYLKHEYNVSDGESTEATKIVETIDETATLNSKQAKVKQQRENALINQN